MKLQDLFEHKTYMSLDVLEILDGITERNVNNIEFFNHNGEIHIKPRWQDESVTINAKDKEPIMKLVLKLWSVSAFDAAMSTISYVRKCGHDYPEFKAIEKSINKAVLESTDDYWKKVLETDTPTPELVTQWLLRALKRAEDFHSPKKIYDMILKDISRARKDGLSSPDLEAIEKSIKGK